MAQPVIRGGCPLLSCAMTETNEEGWPARLAGAIGQNARRFRLAQDMSVQDVTRRCTDLGFKMVRTSLVNLEAGTRKSVTLSEVIVLAEALQVSPLTLIYPLTGTGEVEHLPGAYVSPWGAWSMFVDPLVRAITRNPDLSGTLEEHEYAVVDFLRFESAAGRWKRWQGRLDQETWMQPETRAALQRECDGLVRQGREALATLEEERFNIGDLDADFLGAVRRAASEAAQSDGNSDAAPST